MTMVNCMSEPPYTLEQLAEEFGLTYRTARYYVEKVLPAHHRSGPGKVAEYGRDTWNCFEFIKRAKNEKLTLKQISDVLHRIGQENIDRVAEGEEELTIVPMAASQEYSAPDLVRASRRSMNYLADDTTRSEKASPSSEIEDQSFRDYSQDSDSSPSTPRWQVLYKDDELQITHKGHADQNQRDQIRLTAELIKQILRRK